MVKQYSAQTTHPILTMDRIIAENHPKFQSVGAFLREVSFYEKVHEVNLASQYLLAF